MRKLSNIDDETTARFVGELLYAQDIVNEIRKGEGNVWSVWIHKEEELQRAREIVDGYFADPNAPYFERVRETAKAKRHREKRDKKRSRRQTIDVRATWYAPPTKRGPLTLAMIITCIAVALLSGLGDRDEVIRYLTITDYEISGARILWKAGFSDVESGQIWRLITPIFIHFGVLHILFNMWWLWDLGNAIEHRKSSLYLGLLILVIGVLSNVAQYAITEFPKFGGMSGVVYGLLGYIFIQGKFNRSSGLFVPQQIIWLMMIWLVAGFTGLLGNIANFAHLFGLIGGLLWGYIASGAYKRHLRR